MKNEIPVYILWGEYYNPILDTYVEKVLGCYEEENDANRMADTLRKRRPACKYFVSTKFLCNQEER